MPYIRLSTNKSISQEQKAALKSGLARAVELIPNKSEKLLMVELAGEQTMYYRGKADEAAFIDARFSGEIAFEDKKRFAEAALKLAEQVLELPQGNANLTIDCYRDWGGSGTLLAR